MIDIQFHPYGFDEVTLTCCYNHTPGEAATRECPGEEAVTELTKVLDRKGNNILPHMTEAEAERVEELMLEALDDEAEDE